MDALPAEPFFLKLELGQRFCLFYRPHPDKPCRGAILYVHPFGEEMNKSRRMAALQAKAFAGIGFGVFQMDLFGCGDSSGEFEDARWDIWKQDLVFASNWLRSCIAAPLSVWGLRLGALLALDFARSQMDPIERMILWQPVVNGETYINHFLRLRTANEMLTLPGTQKVEGTSVLRQRLLDGQSLEIAGYDLHPELAEAIDNLRISEMIIENCEIHWFEMATDPSRPLAPSAAKVIAQWERYGLKPKIHPVSCAPFWTTQEIMECPALISANMETLLKRQDEF